MKTVLKNDQGTYKNLESWPRKNFANFSFAVPLDFQTRWEFFELLGKVFFAIETKRLDIEQLKQKKSLLYLQAALKTICLLRHVNLNL